MKKMFRVLFLLPLLALLALLSACDNVPAGSTGVLVKKYGDERGVDVSVRGPGRYFATWNVDQFLFPSFTQTHVWDRDTQGENDPGDESFSFQVEGMSVNTDVGISYLIKPENAAQVFQKYRKGVDEITRVVLRSMVREALNREVAAMSIEEVYGAKRAQLQDRVEASVIEEAGKVGITVENVYFVNEMRLPSAVADRINEKVAATQRAQQKENELRAAEADAAKEIAKARGEAEATRIRGEALRTNPQALQQLAIEKWDGKLPQYIGNDTPLPFLNVK